MDDSSEVVTLTFPDHHQTLTDGLWEFLKTKYVVDFDFNCGGLEVSAHRVILDLFLLPEKLQEAAAERQTSHQLHHRSELACILQFLYKGTVTVHKTQLGILMELARQSDFCYLVDALESVSEVSESEMNLETPALITPKVEKLPIPPQHIPVTLVTENRQSVIETKDDQGTIVVKTEDEVMYEAVPLADRSPEPDDIDWDQIIKNEADCQDALDDGTIESCPTKMFDKNFPSTVDQHNSQGYSGSRSDLVNPGSASTEPTPPILNDMKRKPKAKRQPKGQRQNTTLSSPSRPHRCNECQMAFQYRYHLNRHISVIHSGERPYQCHHCQARFSQTSNLKRHLTTHGELPYKCVPCDVGFENQAGLLRHKATHQVTRQFRCHVCKDTFENDTKLTAHFILAHTETL